MLLPEPRWLCHTLKSSFVSWQAIRILYVRPGMSGLTRESPESRGVTNCR
jgi:hypothetical protein